MSLSSTLDGTTVQLSVQAALNHLLKRIEVEGELVVYVIIDRVIVVFDVELSVCESETECLTSEIVIYGLLVFT